MRGVARAEMEAHPGCTPIVLYQDDTTAKAVQARKYKIPGTFENIAKSNATASTRGERQAQYDSGSKVRVLQEEPHD